MKELFRKFGSVILTLIMLGSTISWTVESHYCMGRLVDVAFFSEADSCGMTIDIDGTAEDSDFDMPCCDDELIVTDGQDELKLNFSSVELVPQPLFLSPKLIWVDIFEDYPVRSPIQDVYPPPKLIRDIQLLDEVFLI